MKRMDIPMHDEVTQALTGCENAIKVCRTLINDPEGRNAETLEDALNEVQDAGYRARRAFRVESVR